VNADDERHHGAHEQQPQAGARRGLPARLTGEELPSLRQAGQEIQPMPDVKRISAPNAIRYQPNGLKSCVET
jgi:hypothetical protein